MAWTTPRTWVTSEVVTAALMNTHVRDNTQYLKDILDGVQGNQTVTLRYAAADTNGQTIYLTKARGSIASPSAITSGDNLGDIWFYGYYNSGYRAGALIRGYNDVAPSGSAVPGALQFYTNPDGSGPYERLRIASTGQTRLGVDGTEALPAISWTGDTDTGIWRSAANTVDFSSGGAQVFQVGTNGVYADTTNGYSFLGDTDTYLTAPSSNAIYCYVGGSARLVIHNSTSLYGQSASWVDTNGACLSVTADGLVPLVVNRNTNDGTLISLQRAASEVGTISVTAGAVAYNPFMGAHYTQLYDDQPEPPLYGVVVTTGEIVPAETDYPEPRENTPYVAPTTTPGDPAVYGVWAGMVRDSAAGSTFGRNDQPIYQVAGVGLYYALVCPAAGDIAAGDLLEAGPVAYHAQRQADRTITAGTLGKAVEPVIWQPGETSRRVACVLYAG